MIAVYLDSAVEKYSRQVRFTLEYIFNISGFCWKYLDADSVLSPNDVILFYSPNLPDQQYIDWMIKNHSLIYIPFLRDFYVKGFISGETLKNNFKVFAKEEMPYISIKKSILSPFDIEEAEAGKYCIYQFDIIGNVFFHLSDDNRAHIKKKDKKGNINFKEFGFYDYFDTPYINEYINLFTYTVKKVLEFKNITGIRCCLWPSNQPFATVITHDLDKMQKWSIFSLVLSFFENIFLLVTFRLPSLFKNLYSILKYLLSNIEDYWNIHEITSLEKKFNIKSTWFVGVNNERKRFYDYEIDDTDLRSEFLTLLENGSEIGLLHKSSDKGRGRITFDIEKLMSSLKLKKLGIRHVNHYTESDTLDMLQNEIGLKYDSSRKLNDKNSFYNGFALPYPMYCGEAMIPNQTVYQFPVHFTDEFLRINKYKNINLTESMNLINEKIEKVKSVKGSLHIQLSNSLYHDISYTPKLYDFIFNELKDSNAYVTTCSGMIEWLDLKRKIEIQENGNRILIKFNDYIEQVTFEIIGNKIVSNVEEGNCSVNRNFVQFVNVFDGLNVEINVIDMEEE